MYINELMQVLEDLRKQHGNIKVMMDYDTITRAVFCDAIPSESEAAFINLEN